MSLLISNETSNKLPNLDCSQPLGWMGRTCGNHPHRTALRCRKCSACALAYYYQKRAEIKTRAKKYFATNNSPVNLWTVGTSWDLDRLQDLRDAWKKFNSRLQKHCPHDMILRVFEVGTKGKKLHVHFITPSYVPHQLVLTTWRKITGEKSNVNVMTAHSALQSVNRRRRSQGKKPLRRLNPLSAVQYLAKYMMKAKFGETEYQIPRAHYIGKVLWETYTLHSVKNHPFSRVDHLYRGTLSTWKKKRYRGTHFIETVTWKDREVPCPHKECEQNLIVKAYSFEKERDGFRIRKLLTKKQQIELYNIERGKME